MSEDKMREEFKRLTSRNLSKTEIVRSYYEFGFVAAWKACAAIKDAEIEREKLYSSMQFDQINELKSEIAEARKTAEYWKAEHLAGNKEIAARDLMIKELRGALLELMPLLDSYGDYSDIRIILFNSENHNSKVLEKMLLEARIDELNKAATFFLLDLPYVSKRITKMAEDLKSCLN